MKKFLNSKTFFATAIVAPIVLSSLTLSAPAQAVEEGYTNYVTDTIDIPVRRGAGYKYKIQNMLKSGTPVKILKVDEEGWVNLEYTRGGKTRTGWMPSSVLQNQPVAAERLQEQIAKTNQAEAQFLEIKQELDTIKTRFDTASKELANFKQENFELTQQLKHLKSVSTNAVELDEQNQTMSARLTELENQNAIMREQIDQSEDVIKRQWFLTGAGVLLLGLLVGRFFRTPSRKRRWGEL